MQDRTHQFAVELARNPEAASMIARILREHTPDDRNKCAGCAMDERVRRPWPCGPHWVAEAAQRIIRRADLRRAV